MKFKNKVNNKRFIDTTVYKLPKTKKRKGAQNGDYSILPG